MELKLFDPNVYAVAKRIVELELYRLSPDALKNHLQKTGLPPDDLDWIVDYTQNSIVPMV